MNPIYLCVFMFGVLVGVWIVPIVSRLNKKDFRSEIDKAKDAINK